MAADRNIARARAHFEWTQAIEDELLLSVASGESMEQACSAPGMPSESTVYRRMAKDAEFQSKMTTARASQQDRQTEECVRMADLATPEDWQVVKLRIWARQWRASKLAPKRYGDKTAVEHSNPDGTALAPPVFHVNFVKPEADNDA